MTSRLRFVLPLALLGLALAPQTPSTAATPAPDCATAVYPTPEWMTCEGANLAATNGSPYGHGDLNAGVLALTAQYQAKRLLLAFTDPERRPNPNPCTLVLLCPIDPRVQDWPKRGGLVKPVTFTSRSGATLSGHVWATAAGPAKRPGVVIINGSIVGFEDIYWYLAQTLAKAGFVVMTFDVQGEGMSDQFGEAPDALEDAFAGTPPTGFLTTKFTGDTFGGNGLPFYDGGTDALNFFLSTPTEPYRPVPSRTTGTSHDAKQQRRVKSGKNAAYNPLWNLLDRSKIGLTGHSYGAVAASWLTQSDRRVSAGVGLDSLCVPVSPSPDEAAAIAKNPWLYGGGVLGGAAGLPRECFGAPNGPAPALTKPALGIAGDYLIPVPYLSPPKPLGKAQASLAYSEAGVDTGQIVIRGGTHLDFNDVPVVLPASLRGIDLTAWYTTAWFLKYLAGDPRGDAMLLTDRWRNDAASAKADGWLHDPNLLSWHFRSRLDVTVGGESFVCEDLRASCAGQTTVANDGWVGEYSFMAAR